MKDNREFPEYVACSKCGYRKWCKLTPCGFICSACARIEKEKTSNKKESK